MKVDHTKNAVRFCTIVNKYDGDVPKIAKELGIREASVRGRYKTYMEKAESAGVVLELASLTPKQPANKPIDFAEVAKTINKEN